MSGLDTPHPASDGSGAGAGGPRGRGRGRQSTAWFGTLGQLDFDIDFFEKLIARSPSSLEALRVLAELVSKKGLVHRAVELDRRLVQMLPDDFLARYNLACSFARAGRTDEAIDALSRAILLGYDDLEHMESDPDLESLHAHPDFLALLGE
jgi:tetratricopeptide (TPR) repeat protein